MEKYFNSYRERISLRGLTDHTLKSYSKENEDFLRFNHRSADKVYKEFMLYAIGRNINKYHRFLCNKLQKFEGKKEENVA